MGVKSGLFGSYYTCPFQENQVSEVYSGRKRAKWKIQNEPFWFSGGFAFWAQFRVVLWDGVIVTEADFQALQAFKHELVDPKGFLRSWNDSGYGACSGGWVGIKCAQGQVIVIQLPWRGLGGRITEKIGQFQALRKLSLHDNFIAGSIPTSLGFLPNLRGVQLFNNRLSGSIPVSLGALLIVLLIICCILICCLIRKRKAAKEAKAGPAASKAATGEKGVPPTASEVEASGETGGKLVHFDGPLVFSADDLLCATAEIMGKSTYGTVYKATMEDGIQVAVKRLREKITKGQREFEIEVNALGKIRHPNLLALRAYYLGPKEKRTVYYA
ncbi:UNVERIFIED_CONTAM: putative leucine-rich repeat receptor-like protein kinase IMK3 [Sesamum angustifolium]|uniref:Leucine-rich repeat receptor-like protein kinase IMK3 n=1 Tax=Sesamum angustifolium TaxID=2727405 RepID=A0AAW2PUT3_9LAMI